MEYLVKIFPGISSDLFSYFKGFLKSGVIKKPGLHGLDFFVLSELTGELQFFSKSVK